MQVKFPFASRAWALPVLAALYRPKKVDQAEGRRHKTPPELARQLMAALIHWFPHRKFISLGDGGFPSHEMGCFCHRHRQHATLISRFHGDANLYAAAPQHRQKRRGRRRIKGRKLAAPCKVVTHSKGARRTVDWYGSAKRRVALISGSGHWYKAGGGLVPLRWVHVHDGKAHTVTTISTVPTRT